MFCLLEKTEVIFLVYFFLECSGMYYTRIHLQLIVGSQPQSPEDIDHLVNVEGVSTILNLQQDHDIGYWGIDIEKIRKRCEEVGVKHYRRPVSFYIGQILSHFSK